MQVIVCNSVEELHTYIDKSQLTPDLGGTIHYNHDDWIREREQLEKLSGVMRDVSAKLDSYIRKLQDTPLPEDVQVVKDLIGKQVRGRGKATIVHADVRVV